MKSVIIPFLLVTRHIFLCPVEARTKSQESGNGIVVPLAVRSLRDHPDAERGEFSGINRSMEPNLLMD
jgi:hypothetical protein